MLCKTLTFFLITKGFSICWWYPFYFRVMSWPQQSSCKLNTQSKDTHSCVRSECSNTTASCYLGKCYNLLTVTLSPRIPKGQLGCILTVGLHLFIFLCFGFRFGCFLAALASRKQKTADNRGTPRKRKTPGGLEKILHWMEARNLGIDINALARTPPHTISPYPQLRPWENIASFWLAAGLS